MIEFLFTLDYEIYGNGHGKLRDLVLDPTQRLAEIFAEFDAPFVNFTEVVELPKIEEAGCDPDSQAVRVQLRKLRTAGHEIALHLHPWWANARYDGASWILDWSERNVCTLEPARIDAIVRGGIQYLREALADPTFTPLSFRSGLWAMQPTQAIADVLARHGICVDSSVFKGGRIGSLGLDYRLALCNNNFWQFHRDVNTPDPKGILCEIPIHTQMVPFWHMLGSKRLKLHNKARTASFGTPLPRRWGDFLRFRYPRKLDFCRMTFEEMRSAIEPVLAEEEAQPDERRFVVAIGHSKDFVDCDSTKRFLAFLKEHSVCVTTFEKVFSQELQPAC